MDRYSTVSYTHLQFHDVLPGSGIPYAYMDTYNDQELAERLMENTLNSGVNSMAYVADTQVDGTPVIVFNALSWARDEMVEVLSLIHILESSQNLKHHNLEHLLKIIDETVVFAQVDFQNKEDVLKYICCLLYTSRNSKT